MMVDQMRSQGAGPGGAQTAAAPMVICPKCSTQNPQTNKFCASCGAKLGPPEGPGTMECPNCKAQIPEGTKFCPECGKPVAAAPATKKCASCGADAPSTSKFCPSCGKAL